MTADARGSVAFVSYAGLFHRDWRTSFLSRLARSLVTYLVSTFCTPQASSRGSRRQARRRWSLMKNFRLVSAWRLGLWLVPFGSILAWGTTSCLIRRSLWARASSFPPLLLDPFPMQTYHCLKGRFRWQCPRDGCTSFLWFLAWRSLVFQATGHRLLSYALSWEGGVLSYTRLRSAHELNAPISWTYFSSWQVVLSNAFVRYAAEGFSDF